MTNLTKEAIQLIADLGERSEKARLHTLPNGAVVLTTPGEASYTSLTSPTLDNHGNTISPPSRIKNGVTIQSADSLVDYIARFKTAGTTLFADITHNAIRAVLDYHEKPENPGHASHTATLRLPYSEEWKAWTAQDTKLTNQLDFARFLRENSADVSAPDPATLIETVRDIQALRKVNFTQAVRLGSDNESFEYQDETNATTRGTINIPEEFSLRLPVYFNGATTSLKAWLRWKLTDGKLELGFNLHRAEHVRQAVFKEVAADIAARAEVPVIYAALAS